jgi:hypothetical protein
MVVGLTLARCCVSAELSQDVLHAKLSEESVRLRDFYRVQLGLRTGFSLVRARSLSERQAVMM